MKKPGEHTLPEIAGQPEAMRAAADELARRPDFPGKYLLKPGTDEVVFIGSGSSYYQAQTMAHAYRAWTGKAAVALPSSELFLFRDCVSSPGRRYVAVGVSRSGESSEAVLALEAVRSLPNWTICGITCYGNSTMARMAECLVSPLGKEKSTVMTKSFSSMTYMMLLSIAAAAGRDDLGKQLAGVPGQAETAVKRAAAEIPAFLEKHAFNKYIYLGMGPFVGIANEACLKIKEMANVWTESFGTLEFRHGPKSIVDNGTLVCLLLSERAREHEIKVAREMKEYGATVLIIAAAAGEDTAFADAVLEVGMAGADDAARSVLHLAPVQYLGCHAALGKGLDPDSPRNLTQVVKI